MHRTLPWSAVLGLCIPALALATSQPPAASARSQSAASTHASAMAGAAGASHIEACTAATGTLIDNLAKGDDKAATSDFDATMQSELGADKLHAAWQQVMAKMGALQRRGAPQNVIYQGHVIITLPLQFAKGAINAQVACDADGKIAGFFMRPAAAP